MTAVTAAQIRALAGANYAVATTLAPLVVSTLLQHGVAWPWVAAAAMVAALAVRPGRDGQAPDASATSRMTTTTPVRARH